MTSSLSTLRRAALAIALISLPGTTLAQKGKTPRPSTSQSSLAEVAVKQLSPAMKAQLGLRDDFRVFTTLSEILSVPASPVPTAKKRFTRLQRGKLIQPSASNLQPNFIRAGAPTAFSTILEYAGTGTNWDTLFQFPTQANNAATERPYVNLPTTFDSTPPAGFQGCYVFYGELGRPTDVTRINFGGNVRSINATTGALTNAKGRVIIYIFDGVSATNPPDLVNGTNIALSVVNSYQGVSLNFAAANTPANYGVTLSDSIRITDPRGRFGFMVAKDTALNADGTVNTAVDDGFNAQWIWWSNSAIGTNSAWQINPATNAVVGTAPVLGGADNSFNQSVRNNYADNVYGSTNGTTFSPTTPIYGAFNAHYQLRGFPQGATTGQTGVAQFVFRNQGVDVPQTGVPEKAPRRYAVIATNPAGTSVVRVDQGFTQPSYDDASIANDSVYYNAWVEGYPVATANGTTSYGMVFLDLPIYTVVNNAVVSNQTIQPTDFPGGDFVPLALTNPLAVKDVAASYANVTNGFYIRFPRAGDITGIAPDSSATPDGQIDLTDLIDLLNRFGASSSSPNYSADADLAGPADADFSGFGAPDGNIDLTDLIYLLNLFGLGGYEAP